MKILVLGGDGFIGSHFVDEAVSAGHDVAVFGRFPYQTSRNLEHHKHHLKLITGEFGNRDSVLAALKGNEIVYHFISSTNPATSWNDPFIEVDQNLRESIQLFELAAQAGVKKIVFPSSGGTVYGHQNHIIDEHASPRPFSPYGIVKLTTELFLNYYQKKTGLHYDIYRIGNAYGPRQAITRSQGVIGTWMCAILENKPIHVYGGQETLRDYIYVKDAAYLMTHSLKHPEQSGIYNVGSGIGTSVLDLLKIFKKSISDPFKIELQPRRDFDNSYVVLDNSKIMSHFPKMKLAQLEDKIQETWEFCKKKHATEKK